MRVAALRGAGCRLVPVALLVQLVLVIQPTPAQGSRKRLSDCRLYPYPSYAPTSVNCQFGQGDSVSRSLFFCQVVFSEFPLSLTPTMHFSCNVCYVY